MDSRNFHNAIKHQPNSVSDWNPHGISKGAGLSEQGALYKGTFFHSEGVIKGAYAHGVNYKPGSYQPQAQGSEPQDYTCKGISYDGADLKKEKSKSPPPSDDDDEEEDETKENVNSVDEENKSKTWGDKKDIWIDKKEKKPPEEELENIEVHMDLVKIKNEFSDNDDSLDEEQEDDDLEFEDDDNSDLELSKIQKIVKAKGGVSENSRKPKHKGKRKQYDSFISKSYTLNSVKQEPIDDLKMVFSENSLEVEKQKYYQNIVEDLWHQNSNQIKLKELQAKFLEHLRQAANLEVFSCLFCSYETLNKRNLKCHLFVIHSKKTSHKIYKCKSCNYENESKDILKRHLKLHLEEEGIFECPHCKYIAPSERGLKIHVGRTHSDHVCDFCGYTGKDNTDVKKHIADSHTVPGQHAKYKCHKCEHEEFGKMKMFQHLLSEHQIVNERLKLAKCTQCDYSASTLQKVQRHAFLKHTNPEEIEHLYCDQCSFKTKTQHNLKRHIMAIHVEKKHQVFKIMCDKCPYKCQRSSELKLHMLTHFDISEMNDDELFKCKLCSFKGKTKTSLHSHMYTHSEKKLKCELCGFATRRPKYFRDHKKLHMKSTEVKIHKCEFCAYQTKFKPSYNKHMKRGDHSGNTLKFIPHRFRIENTDNPNFDPKLVRFGPGPKKKEYDPSLPKPKYVRKSKKQKAAEENLKQAPPPPPPPPLQPPNVPAYSFPSAPPEPTRVDRHMMPSSSAASESFFHFIYGEHVQ